MPRKSSIGAELFRKVQFLIEISKISKNLEKSKNNREGRSCSTSYPSGNQVDGSPLVAIPNRGELASPWTREDS